MKAEVIMGDPPIPGIGVDIWQLRAVRKTAAAKFGEAAVMRAIDKYSATDCKSTGTDGLGNVPVEHDDAPYAEFTGSILE